MRAGRRPPAAVLGFSEVESSLGGVGKCRLLGNRTRRGEKVTACALAVLLVFFSLLYCCDDKTNTGSLLTAVGHSDGGCFDKAVRRVYFYDGTFCSGFLLAILSSEEASRVRELIGGVAWGGGKDCLHAAFGVK